MSERKLRAYVEIPTHLGPDVTINQTITNISLSGCLLRTDTNLEIGTAVALSISLSRGTMLRLEGKVVRKHEKPNGYGIGFKTISDDDVRRLALLIADTDDRMS